jgi:hypothetical protein
VVPLPGRIYLAGEAAEITARLIFEEKLEEHDHLKPFAQALAHGQLRLRTYVTRISDYKRQLRSRGLPEDVRAWHANQSASHWVWVVELQDVAAATKGPVCALGEIAIDATSDDQWANPLFANLPGRTIQWPELGTNTREAESSQDSLYRTGCALHARTPAKAHRRRTPEDERRRARIRRAAERRARRRKL